MRYINVRLTYLLTYFALFDPRARDQARSLDQSMKLYLRPNFWNTFDGHLLHGC